MFAIKRRPYLIHFHCLLVNETISVRAGVSSRSIKHFSSEHLVPSIPIRDFRLLSKNSFSVLIKVHAEEEVFYEKLLETDQFGHLNYRINTSRFKVQSTKLTVSIYEVSTIPKVEIFLGKSDAISVDREKPIIISDFDKTLVDTKYKTTVELYHSLTSPLKKFPTVESTLEQFAPLIEQQSPIFILSASPHFYENAIRSWLKEKDIKDSGIFLKDYRHFLSFQNTELFSKDIKVHGTFKLSQLLNLIYILDFPKKLVLFGDNSETDPLIYALFKYLLTNNNDPTDSWDKIKELEAFKLTNFQDSKLLNRLHLTRTLRRKKQHNPDISINIRDIYGNKKVELPSWLEQYRSEINLY